MKIRTLSFILLTIFSLVLVFHFMVLSGLVPYHAVWGGRLQSEEEMKVFESISILINLLMMAVVAMAGGFLSWKPKPLVLSILLYIMMALFALNTVGNMMAVDPLEKWIATPLTMISAILCWRLAVGVGKG